MYIYISLPHLLLASILQSTLVCLAGGSIHPPEIYFILLLLPLRTSPPDHIYFRNSQRALPSESIQTDMPVSHLTLTVAHLPTSTSFFLSCLQPLGYQFIGRHDDYIGFGQKTGEPADFWITEQKPG